MSQNKRFTVVLNEFDEIEYITDIVDCEDRDFKDFLDYVNEMAEENEKLKKDLEHCANRFTDDGKNLLLSLRS